MKKKRQCDNNALTLSQGNRRTFKRMTEHWDLSIFLPSLGRVDGEERVIGEGSDDADYRPHSQWTPPRKLASSFATLPKEGKFH